MSSPQKQHTHRKRATTRALLGDAYVEHVQDVLKRPHVEKDASSYPPDRLKRSLYYADATLRNRALDLKVSPLTSSLLTLYKASVKDLLLGNYDGNDDKEVLVAHVMTAERQMRAVEFLRLPWGEAASDIIRHLCELRRYEFAARYGDYTKDVCERLKVPSHSYIKARYIETSLAVESAYNASGLNLKAISATIAIYADRDSFVHMSMLQMVEEGIWQKLRAVLFCNVTDIPKVMPDHLRHTIPILEGVVEAVIDTYFTRRKDDPLNINYWDPKPSSYNMGTQLREEKKKKAKIALVAEEREKVANLAEERIKAMEDRHTSVGLLTAISGMPVPSGNVSPKKDLDHKEHGSWLEAHMKRKKAWDTMMAMGGQVHRRMDDYVSNHDSVQELVDPDVWFDMIEEDKETKEVQGGEG
ncbi:hypothetical protein CONLIGDRAFT_686731 [Coniochaeta ligniaria NRRL 30616]|uniref:Uncharacterized protein n=1 Tax=Coniochaeta ligniaria NRRL 30616 TaxID=1408157 RepID=A0A1J7I794_9PEZI|nr:hypothetical protein CONLIGDRAFT_686731 [Coniochaeta ligniaria NRRL 30616]